jgi:hypothetical protein
LQRSRSCTGSDEQNSTATETNDRGKPFVVEERVYLRTNNIHVKQRSKKLNNKSIKPFKIKKETSRNKL